MKCLIKFTLILALNLEASAFSKTLETEDFEVIFEKITRLGKLHRIENTLVVYDLDNTLLATNQDLGSDQWSDWQQSLIAQKTPHPERVADDMNSFFSLQQKIYTLSGMRPTQASIPQLLHSLEAQGYFQIILTARGTDMRESTHRDLIKNNINLGAGDLNPNDIKTSLPINPKDPKASCLTSEEVLEYKLTSPRPVSYGQRILLSAGQHKGAVLKSFICQHNFRAIVFVDDKIKNIQAVESAFKNTSVDLTTYHFRREDAEVARFHNSDKSAVNADWKKFKSLMDEVFL